MEWFFFIVAAAITVAAAVMVVVARNPVFSALWLVLSFCGTAGLFLLERAQLIAVVQVVVYAGAIIVFFLFVIMLLNLKPEPKGEGHRVHRGLALYLGAVFMLLLAFAVYIYGGGAGRETADPAVVAELGRVEPFAMALFTRYLFPFEVASLLLLGAMVGAVAIARRER